MPYLDSNIAANILNNDVTAFLSINPPAGSIAECRISTSNPNPSGLDRVVCGMSNAYGDTAAFGRAGPDNIVSKSLSEQIELLNQDAGNFIEVLEDYQAKLAGGSFAYSYRIGDLVVLRFLGVNQSSSIGVACYIVFPGLEAYDDSVIGRDEGLRILSDLTHEIANHL